MLFLRGRSEGSDLATQKLIYVLALTQMIDSVVGLSLARGEGPSRAPTNDQS